MKAEQETTEHSPNAGVSGRAAKRAGTLPAFERLFAWLRRPGRDRALDSAPALRKFLTEQAAFVAQKSAIDYCRGKTGLFAPALFEEKTFVDALTICRWETFAAAAADVLIIAEGLLRSTAGAAAPAVAARLKAFYPKMLMDQEQPEHRSQGWDDAIAAFAERFDHATREPPRPAADVGLHTARRLFETLPIHAKMRKLDEEVVHGAVCFRMVAFRQRLDRRLDRAAVIRDMLDDGAG